VNVPYLCESLLSCSSPCCEWSACCHVVLSGELIEPSIIVVSRCAAACDRGRAVEHLSVMQRNVDKKWNAAV
jgi:hypothetical protein